MNIHNFLKWRNKDKPKQKMVDMPPINDKSSQIKADLICKAITGNVQSELERQRADDAFEEFHNMVTKIGNTFPEEYRRK